MTQDNPQYHYVCVIEYGWWMYAFIWRYMDSHNKNNIWPKPKPNINMCHWVWMMDVCFHMTVHGKSPKNNTWPKPRPNTNMRDWVRMMLSYDGTWSVTIKTTYYPNQDPIPICMIDCGWWMYAFIWGYMVSHHNNNIWPKPRPNTNMCEWVWMMDVCCQMKVHGHTPKNNTWPKPRPNTIMCDWVWMMDVCFHMMVHGQSP